MKKQLRKITAIVLTEALTLTMLPTFNKSNEVSAASDMTLQNPRIVSDSSMQSGQRVTWDCIWFGSYPQAEVIPEGEYTALDSSLLQEGDVIVSNALYSKLQSATDWDDDGDIIIDGNKYRRINQSDASTVGYSYNWSDSTTYHYFKYEPIKWRVLNVNGDEAFLLSDRGLDSQQYNTIDTAVTWESSTLRSWLNGYGAFSNVCETDYSNKNFIDTAFSTLEQSAIQTTIVVNDDNISYGTEGGNDTNDKVFLLSESEVYTESAIIYGFSSNDYKIDEARRSKSSTYAKAMGTISVTSSVEWDQGNGHWWLRSPGNNVGNFETSVYYNGFVDCSGYDVDNKYTAVRPALHLNLSYTNLYSYAGTVCSNGTKNEQTSESNPAEQETEETTPSYEGNSLQCSASCTVREEGNASVIIQAYGNSYEELKTVVDSVSWTAQDSSKISVSTPGFIMPLESTQYTREDGGTYETWIANGLLRVEGLKEGDTTITGTASDGSKVTCKVKVIATSDSDEDLRGGSGGSFTIGADASGTAGGGVVTFFPDSWSAKSTIFPVEISKSTKDDGTYKIRGTVGIGRSDLFDNETTWNQFKQNVSDAQKYTGRVDCLESYKQTWDVKSLTTVSTSKFKILPKLSVMGYFENTYDKNGNLIASAGKLAADAKWSGSINWQFASPIGPIYLNLGGSGKLSGEIGTEYDCNAEKLNVVTGSLKFTPQVTLEGGYGIDKVAQIGAQGSLSVPITLIPATQGELTAKASLHLKLLFVIDYTKELVTYKETLWPLTAKSTSLSKNRMKFLNEANIEEENLALMDTSFSKSTSEWNGEIPVTSVSKQQARGRMSATTNTSNKDFEATLMSGVLPSTMPIQKEIGGKKVMIFQSYDDTKDTLNSTVLMYSVYENGAWSTPQPVWDNGYADMYADMKVVNNKLVVAWQKEKAVISGDIASDSETVLKDIARNAEICYAEFDAKTNTFKNQTYVTNNVFYDMMPQICNDSEEVIISWVRNSEAELMQETGTNYIYMSKWNGESFDEEQMILQSVGTVDNYITYGNGTDIEAVYTGQQNDVKAVFNTNNQIIESLSELMMFSDEGTISSINYDNGTIEFISGGNIYRFDSNKKEVTKMQAGTSAFANTAVYCTNGEKSGYIWSTYDEESETGKIVASMKTENGYSEPVTLYERENTMWRCLSPIIDEKGNWNIVTNALDTANELNSIIDIGKQEETNIELAGASVDEDDIKDGLTGINYFVTNTGDTTIDTINIKIIGEDGIAITKEEPITLTPGESIAATAYFDISKINSKQEISISVYANNQKEINTVTDVVGLDDVSVSGSYVESGNNVDVFADVCNSSERDAKTVVHLYSDETMTKEIAISKENVIAAGEKQTLHFSLPEESVIYNENNAAYLTLKVEALDGDFNEDNNVSYVVLYKNGQTTVETPLPDTTQNNVETETVFQNHTMTETTNGNNGITTKSTEENNIVKNPKTTKIKKVTKKRKSLKVTWKKKAGVNGYQLQYSTSKKFKKSKRITIKNGKTTSKNIKKLKSKKKYYIRIRTYITVNGKKYYSKWSKIKSQKTK